MSISQKILNNKVEKLFSGVFENKIAPVVATAPVAFSPDTMNLQYLKDGSGNISMGVNGAVVPVTFQYVVPAGFQARVSSIFIILQDDGIEVDGFGGLTELTNGWLLQVFDNNNTLRADFTFDRPITQNIHFFDLGGSNEIFEIVGVTEGFVVTDVDITRHGGLLRLEPGWSIRVLVQDDLSGINSFTTRIISQLLPEMTV